MLYNEQIQMDESMRLVVCPRCENEQFSKQAKYCRICGLPLYNYCTDERCEVENPENARFCETCGAPTIFNTLNILRPYNEVNPSVSASVITPVQENTFDVSDDELPF